MEDLTRKVNLISFGIAGLSVPDSFIPEISTTERTIFSVALASYVGLEFTNDNAFRYFDWAVTTPLLLYTYWKLADKLGWNRPFEFLGLSAAAMSILGYAAEIGYAGISKELAYIFSSLFFVLIIIEVIAISNFLQSIIPADKQSLIKLVPWFFYLGWSLYPIAFFFNTNLRHIVWNILDFINKPIYTLVYNSALQEIF